MEEAKNGQIIQVIHFHRLENDQNQDSNKRLTTLPLLQYGSYVTEK